jgi:hypothetical protein
MCRPSRSRRSGAITVQRWALLHTHMRMLPGHQLYMPPCPSCSFFAALNARDISGMLGLCSPTVQLLDLSHEQPAVRTGPAMSLCFTCLGSYLCPILTVRYG